MATKFITPNWRMPKNSNQSKASNYSIDFNNDGYIDINPGASNTVDLTSFTISAWVKWDTESSSYGTAIRLSTSGDDIWMYVGRSTGFNFGVRFYLGNTLLDDTDFLPTNEWKHVVIRFQNDENSMKIYVDGQEKVSSTANKNPSLWNTTTNNQIGANGGGSEKMQGRLSQINIFDYALSTGSISALYNGGIPSNPLAVTTPPVAFYDLGQGSAYAEGSAGIVEPNLSQATGSTVFDFEGDDKIDINGVNSVFSNATNFTISGWFNWENYGNANEWLFMASATNINTRRVQLETYNKQLYFGFLVDSAGAGVLRVNMTTAQWDAKWVHMVAVFDANAASADKMIVYFNGTRAANAAYTEPTGNSPTDIVNVSIGNRTDGLYNFEGQISNFQIWDSSLLVSEVSTLYNNGTPLQSNIPQSGSLKAWYKLGLDTSIWNNTQNRWQISNSESSYLKSFNMNPLGIQATSSLGYQDGTNAFSGGAWVNIRSSNQYIMSRQRGRISSTGAYPGWSLRTVGSGGAQGDPQFQIETNGDGNVRVKSLSYTLQDGLWHFVAFTYDGSRNTSGIKIYVDGYEDTNRQVLENNMTGTVPNYSTPFMIGGSYRNNSNVRGGSNQFMSNAMYFESELSATDILTLYNNGQPLSDLSPFTSLKGWWKLDNNATYNNNIWTIPDASGNGNEGTSDSTMGQNNRINLAVDVNNGISSGMDTTNLVPSNLIKSIPYSGYSMLFDGNDEWVDIPDSSTLDLGSNASFSYWVKWDDIDKIHCFASRYDSGQISWYIQKPTLQNIEFGSAAGYFLWPMSGFTDVTSGADPEWYHFMFVYDGAKSDATQLKLYVNSVLQTQSSYSTLSNPLPNTTSKLRIGNFSDSYTTREFNGYMSNFAIWNKTLSEDEILRVYNGGSPGDLSNLGTNNWWSLGVDSYFNGSEWICPDLSSNNDNGTTNAMEADSVTGIGPDSLANGTSTNLDLGSDLIGEAPGSTGNAISINMNSLARTGSTP